MLTTCPPPLSFLHHLLPPSSALHLLVFIVYCPPTVARDLTLPLVSLRHYAYHLPSSALLSSTSSIPILCSSSISLYRLLGPAAGLTMLRDHAHARRYRVERLRCQDPLETLKSTIREAPPLVKRTMAHEESCIRWHLGHPEPSLPLHQYSNLLHEKRHCVSAEQPFVLWPHLFHSNHMRSSALPSSCLILYL